MGHYHNKQAVCEFCRIIVLWSVQAMLYLYLKHRCLCLSSPCGITRAALYCIVTARNAKPQWRRNLGPDRWETKRKAGIGIERKENNWNYCCLIAHTHIILLCKHNAVCFLYGWSPLVNIPVRSNSYQGSAINSY